MTPALASGNATDPRFAKQADFNRTQWNQWEGGPIADSLDLENAGGAQQAQELPPPGGTSHKIQGDRGSYDRGAVQPGAVDPGCGYRYTGGDGRCVGMDGQPCGQMPALEKSIDAGASSAGNPPAATA